MTFRGTERHRCAGSGTCQVGLLGPEATVHIVELDTAVALINERHHAAWRISDRLAGGWQQGSFLLEGSPGRAVVKFGQSSQRRLDQLAVTVAELRRRGWPPP